MKSKGGGCQREDFPVVHNKQKYPTTLLQMQDDDDNFDDDAGEDDEDNDDYGG